MNIVTTVTLKSVPEALHAALLNMQHKGRDVRIEARAQTHVSEHSQAYYVRNVVITDLDEPASCVTRNGVWGGDNGYNKPPADRAWDPVFDDQPRDVPLNGAIVVGLVGKHVSVYVHPTTFAERFSRHDVAKDALLEGRAIDALSIQSDADNLSDEECAILYAHHCYKSGEYRKRVVARYLDAMESCVSRGLIKRSSNGACTITTSGKACETTFRKRGEPLAWRF